MKRKAAKAKIEGKDIEGVRGRHNKVREKLFQKFSCIARKRNSYGFNGKCNF